MRTQRPMRTQHHHSPWPWHSSASGLGCESRVWFSIHFSIFALFSNLTKGHPVIHCDIYVRSHNQQPCYIPILLKIFHNDRYIQLIIARCQLNVILLYDEIDLLKLSTNDDIQSGSSRWQILSLCHCLELTYFDTSILLIATSEHSCHL